MRMPRRRRSLRRPARRRPDRANCASAIPDAEFAGIGGDAMRAAGLDAWHDAARTGGDGPGRSAAPPAAPAARCAARCASACWRGSRTCSSASTRPTSTSAWSAGSRSAASAPCITSARRSGPGARSARRRSAAAPTACCACSRWSRRSMQRMASMRASSAIRSPTRCRCEPDRGAARAQLGLDRGRAGAGAAAGLARWARSSAWAAIFLAAAARVLAEVPGPAGRRADRRTRARAPHSSACWPRIPTPTRCARRCACSTATRARR